MYSIQNYIHVYSSKQRQRSWIVTAYFKTNVQNVGKISIL